jgi:hypothetical protein
MSRRSAKQQEQKDEESVCGIFHRRPKERRKGSCAPRRFTPCDDG